MTDGLIASYEGRVIICVILGGLGLLLSLTLTFAAWITGGLFGVKRGIGAWFLGFIIVFVAPAMLALIIVTGVEVTHWFKANAEILPIGAAALGLAAVLWFGVRHLLTRPEPVPAPAPEVTPTPVQGWSMPPTVENWDR